MACFWGLHVQGQHVIGSAFNSWVMEVLQKTDLNSGVQVLLCVFLCDRKNGLFVQGSIRVGKAATACHGRMTLASDRREDRFCTRSAYRAAAHLPRHRSSELQVKPPELQITPGAVGAAAHTHVTGESQPLALKPSSNKMTQREKSFLNLLVRQFDSAPR